MQSQGQSELDHKAFFFNGKNGFCQMDWVVLTQRVCSADTGGFSPRFYYFAVFSQPGKPTLFPECSVSWPARRFVVIDCRMRCIGPAAWL